MHVKMLYKCESTVQTVRIFIIVIIVIWLVVGRRFESN